MRTPPLLPKPVQTSLPPLSDMLRECFMVTYVTLATSMGGWGMAIGGVTHVTRNIYGRGGACQDMQSDVHCLRLIECSA